MALLASPAAADKKSSDANHLVINFAGDVAWPAGYAEPARSPLHPQEKAEIMALGIPVGVSTELLVTGLEDVLMGEATAREIGWFDR